GLISAHLTKSNLADFNNWRHWGGLNCQKVVTYKNKIYAGIDSIVQVFDGVSLKPFLPSSNSTIVSLQNDNNLLTITRSDSLIVTDENAIIRSYREINLNQTILVKGNRLVCCSKNSSLYFIEPNNNYNYFSPNGPQTSKASDFAFDDNNLWVAPEGPTSTWILSFNPDRFSSYNNVEWNNYRQNDTNFNNTFSFWKTAVRPIDKHVFFGSWGTGLLEFFQGSVLSKFDSKNSPLEATKIGGVTSTLIGGMTFDTSSNLWFTNAQSTKPLCVYTKGGQWLRFGLGSLASVGDIPTDVVIDDNNYKWIAMARGKGIIVYDDNGTLNNPFDDQYKQITSEKTKGYLPDMSVNCITKDHDGNIWVGTDKGLTVFYTPGNVFNGQNFDAQQIIISKNGKAAYLFGDLGINHIAVDAGNRKWIATKNGVYLISPDGQNFIFNFNKSNSPLLSDYVQRIGIHPKTGEVFFATDQGVVSYQGDALPGVEEFGDIVIYPNPVKETYDGLIANKGLYNNANVKITDIAGNFVYETRANGSVATWNSQNFKGERAQTGVYLVFCSNADGTSTEVGKIVLIH
ncbi:MAG: T9SS type A sorting domain-containing protein, partial [Bacteroidetes bacterium]|nr:T9SS type A sorting domain-containing protein [Bacteroidota bacterium]